MVSIRHSRSLFLVVVVFTVMLVVVVSVVVVVVSSQMIPVRCKSDIAESQL